VAGRIVLFGATGFTGELTARALTAEAGSAPVVLAARSEARVRALAEELGGLEWAVADVEKPSTVRALVERGDVLLSTVGPFNRWGEPAVAAAVDAGAHYLDSTGEGRFIRRVFDEYGPRAEGAGCGLLTAFGYDWVPGNLVGALALAQAGADARKVRVGYFVTGEAMTPRSLSGGTRASASGVMLDRGFAYRDGTLVGERPAKWVRRFEVGPGRWVQALSVSSTEHLCLPRVHPQLSEVDVYLGWFGPGSRAIQGFSAAMSAVLSVPGARTALDRLLARFLKGSTGGPDQESRGKGRSLVIGEALDADGGTLATVRLEGVNGYEFTGRILAWGAQTAAGGGLRETGALGPVDGFGLEALERGCAQAGVRRVP
jgi:short subunit dehydrogenase-like uncharacterized protein